MDFNCHVSLPEGSLFFSGDTPQQQKPPVKESHPSFRKPLKAEEKKHRYPHEQWPADPGYLHVYWGRRTT